MASSYFTLPSFARAKKNQEDLEKTNPQAPILNDDDEKFLNKQISTDEAAPQLQQNDDAPAAKITDDGEVKEVSREEAGGDVVVPETQPEGKVETLPEEKQDGAEPGATQGDGSDETAEQEPSYDDKLKEKAAAAKQARKAKKDKGFELPSQEEAEAATRGFNTQLDQQGQDSQGEKRTWKSYLSSVRPGSRKGEDGTTTDQPSTSPSDQTQDQRTWTQYASSYVPTIPATWKPKRADPDAQPHPIYNADGTVDEAATKAQQEREVSVLLDNLNLSSINNRVFPLTQETQKYYERFAQCLKDIIAGAPTAYEDMDTLMREAGPRLEQQFKSMPPFVQTLVKSLPARMGGVVGPELLAAVGEKPGADMKARMEAASRPGAADGGINMSAAGAKEGKESDGKEVEGKKSKRRVPTLKSLVGEKSAVAGILRSTVNFIQTRFPFLASTTNVVMSLSVFILMFVFWYCHKRGREVRLAREAAEADGVEGGEVEEVDASEDDDDDDEDGEDDKGDGDGMEKDIEEKANVLSQPDPTDVPLPDGGEKMGAAVDEQKTSAQ